MDTIDANEENINDVMKEVRRITKAWFVTVLSPPCSVINARRCLRLLSCGMRCAGHRRKVRREVLEYPDSTF